MKLNEYRERIPLKEMAEFLGYVSLSGPMARNLTYILGNRNNPEDEIVIFPSKNSYFSRKGNFNDKGNLINFILNRLHLFPSCTQTGFAAVHEILSNYLNNSQTIIHKKYSHQESNAPKEITFDINYWNPKPLEKNNPYLIDRRRLSPKTVDDFSSRLFIYQVGKNNHIGFPFRKPSQMEILNFEMRNFFPATGTNYKGFATGGDKTESCWIANFVPFDKVTDVYLFESAIDAMSFYEISHFTKETTSAFISTGGYVTQKQISCINKVFPHSEIKWHCCYDNDASGKGFDVATAHYLAGEECKVFARTNPGEIYKTIYISFPDGENLIFKEEEFSSEAFLHQIGKDNIEIIKPPKYKDWNELLTYYKRFDLDLEPGMKFLPAMEEITSQLNLRGYIQLSEAITASKRELINQLLNQGLFCISAPLAESKTYTLMVDCNLFMGFKTIIPIPNNLYIIDNVTQKQIPAYSMNEFFKKEHINIFKDLHSQDLRKILENHTLNYTKGDITKNFEKVVTPHGWGLKEDLLDKKKDNSVEQGI